MSVEQVEQPSPAASSPSEVIWKQVPNWFLYQTVLWRLQMPVAMILDRHGDESFTSLQHWRSVDWLQPDYCGTTIIEGDALFCCEPQLPWPVPQEAIQTAVEFAEEIHCRLVILRDAYAGEGHVRLLFRPTAGDNEPSYKRRIPLR